MMSWPPTTKVKAQPSAKKVAISISHRPIAEICACMSNTSTHNCAMYIDMASPIVAYASPAAAATIDVTDTGQPHAIAP